jgi:hypothetical protein
MKIRFYNWHGTLFAFALIGLLVSLVGCAVSASAPGTTAAPSTTTSAAQPATNIPKTVETPKTPQNIISVAVVGTIKHGPMQPTVQAIKDVLAKYGDKVNTTWYDMITTDGAKYAKDHNLDAHLNILINGTYKYTVDGKTIEFQWFEGQQWTKQDLDTVLSTLSNK